MIDSPSEWRSTRGVTVTRLAYAADVDHCLVAAQPVLVIKFLGLKKSPLVGEYARHMSMPLEKRLRHRSRRVSIFRLL